MSTAPIVEPTEDPGELLDLLKRRAARRRQLAVALASMGLVLAYLGGKVGSHRLASSWLRASHYKVFWEADKDNWKRGGSTTVKFVAHWDVFQSTRSNVDLKFLTWLHRVEELDLSQSPGLRDRDLVGLDTLTDLRSLDLDRSRQLAWLKNDQGQLTDATLGRIKHLRRLENLNLGGQPITDAGLANLADLKELQSLDLRGTGITDAGLEHLQGLPRLKSLDLSGTQVTPKGVRDFEATRPGVTVLADPPPLDAKRPEVASQTMNATIRPARLEDAPTIATLIRELAAYEKLEDHAKATADDLARHLFGDRPAAEAIIAEVDGTPVGFALFFTTFSTFRGQPGLYLEDLFVRPEHRGQGIGKALLADVAKAAVDRGYGRLAWTVLDWNTPSIDFYRSQGAEPMDDWTVFRVADRELIALAAKCR